MTEKSHLPTTSNDLARRLAEARRLLKLAGLDGKRPRPITGLSQRRVVLDAVLKLLKLLAGRPRSSRHG